MATKQVRIDESLLERLSQRATEQGVEVNIYVQAVLLGHLVDQSSRMVAPAREPEATAALVGHAGGQVVFSAQGHFGLEAFVGKLEGVEPNSLVYRADGDRPRSVPLHQLVEWFLIKPKNGDRRGPLLDALFLLAHKGIVPHQSVPIGYRRAVWGASCSALHPSGRTACYLARGHSGPHEGPNPHGNGMGIHEAAVQW